LICFGPSGPNLKSLVVATASAEVNYMEKVAGRACRVSLARFARPCLQKCELFWILRNSRSERNILFFLLESSPAFLDLDFLNRAVGCMVVGCLFDTEMWRFPYHSKTMFPGGALRVPHPWMYGGVFRMRCVRSRFGLDSSSRSVPFGFRSEDSFVRTNLCY